MKPPIGDIGSDLISNFEVITNYIQSNYKHVKKYYEVSKYIKIALSVLGMR